MIAPAQIGTAPSAPPSYGNAVIVDPWGTVLARAAHGEMMIVAEIDDSYQDQVSQRCPASITVDPTSASCDANEHLTVAVESRDVRLAQGPAGLAGIVSTKVGSLWNDLRIGRSRRSCQAWCAGRRVRIVEPVGPTIHRRQP